MENRLAEIPDYRLNFGIEHESASNGTTTKDEMILKHYLRKEHKMSFPMASRPIAGIKVQTGVDCAMGLHNFSPIRGVQEPMDINEAVRYALTEYQGYTPRTWDNGKDAEEYEEFREHIPEMIKHAVDGLHKYFEGVNRIEGESMKQFVEPKIDVPVVLYQDYSGGGRQIDLKCSLPMRNPPKKDGTRSWRVPKPKTEPSAQQVMQQAVYWKATGEKPALLFVTASGYNIVDETNCELMTEDNLQKAYDDVVRSWLVTQNLLKASRGSWKTLAGLVQPDMVQIAQRHGPNITNLAKQLWSIT
tara:strand:- start:210 stop:1115 length:906 start_codon:yes stop_codon:yes gene_type:complete